MRAAGARSRRAYRAHSQPSATVEPARTMRAGGGTRAARLHGRPTTSFIALFMRIEPRVRLVRAFMVVGRPVLGLFYAVLVGNGLGPSQGRENTFSTHGESRSWKS